MLFTDFELELHGEEMELVEELELIMHKVEAEHRTPLGRILRLEYYKRAK